MAYNTNEDVSKMFYSDFLNFYETMASENPEMVRANLSFSGLRADMRPIPKAGEPDDVLNLHKSHQEMPRYKVANDAHTFQTLLKCLDLDSDTRKDANEIIMQACTNERILSNVLRVSPEMFDWDLRKKDGSTEVVYTLTMIEQILFNKDDNSVDVANLTPVEVEIRELKATWITRFLKSGCLDKLTQMLETVLALFKDGKKAETISSEDIVKLKMILGTTIKIVKFFVTATVCSLKNDAKAEVFSFKQTSSALTKRLLQGSITSVITNKYLRRADREEEDLEAKLEKSCTSQAAAVSFFGIPLKNTSKSLAKTHTSETSATPAGEF